MAINGKTIIGTAKDMHQVQTAANESYAITYFSVTNNDANLGATINIIAGSNMTHDNTANKIIEVIPLPPQKTYYSPPNFKLIMDGTDVTHFFVRNSESGSSTATDDKLVTAISYFTK